MDCLDRTNVVQSVIARLMLHKQLWAMGAEDAPSGKPFDAFAPFLEDKFREGWTDNAN